MFRKPVATETRPPVVLEQMASLLCALDLHCMAVKNTLKGVLLQADTIHK